MAKRYIATEDNYELALPAEQIPLASSDSPSVGFAKRWAREDHIHPKVEGEGEGMYDNLIKQSRLQTEFPINFNENMENFVSIPANSMNTKYVLSFQIGTKFTRGALVFTRRDPQYDVFDKTIRQHIVGNQKAKTILVTNNVNECRRLCSRIQVDNGEYKWTEMGNNDLLDKTYAELEGMIEKGTNFDSDTVGTGYYSALMSDSPLKDDDRAFIFQAMWLEGSVLKMAIVSKNNTKRSKGFTNRRQDGVGMNVVFYGDELSIID